MDAKTITIVTENDFFIVIYKYPKDFPGKYVVRKWLPGGRFCALIPSIVSDTIEGARKVIPETFVNIGCDPIDPTMVEVWCTKERAVEWKIRKGTMQARPMEV